jgi:hypothetical protein
VVENGGAGRAGLAWARHARRETVTVEPDPTSRCPRDRDLHQHVDERGGLQAVPFRFCSRSRTDAGQQQRDEMKAFAIIALASVLGAGVAAQELEDEYRAPRNEWVAIKSQLRHLES